MSVKKTGLGQGAALLFATEEEKYFECRPRQSWISNSLGTLCFIEFVLKLDIRSECFK